MLIQLTDSDKMETRVRGRSTGHGIWKKTDSDARTPAPHSTLIRPYLSLLISLSLCKMRMLETPQEVEVRIKRGNRSM